MDIIIIGETKRKHKHFVDLVNNNIEKLDPIERDTHQHPEIDKKQIKKVKNHV